MFEILIDSEGRKKVLPTDNSDRAVRIIIPKGKNRCPFCDSNKCLTNIIEEALVLPEWFKKSPKSAYVRYIDVAICKKFKQEFLIAKSIRFSAEKILAKRCMWCDSGAIAKISNLQEARQSLFHPVRLKKYRLFVLGESGEDGFVHSQIKGMTIDEFNLLFFENPVICKQCKRISGYRPDWDDGGKMLDKLMELIRIKELYECMRNLGIEQRFMSLNKDKCPLCSAEIAFEDYTDETFFEILPWTEKSLGFTISKCKCRKCHKYFFIWMDEYNVL